MARKGEPCKPSLECPLYPNCYEDGHHEIPRRVGRFALRAFQNNEITESHLRSVLLVISHPMNKIVGCRWVHATELDGATSDRIPTEDEANSWLKDNTAREESLNE